MSDILERYCASIGNVVVRDSNGKPSIFVRHPKVNSSFFDSSLPDHVHPAFVCGSETDNAVLIGKYLCSRLTAGGTLYSLPNAPVSRDVSISDVENRTNCPDTASFLTIAAYGMLLLSAHKAGVAHIYGSVRPDPDTVSFSSASRAVAVGDERVFDGVKYRCIQAHTTSASLLPPDHPEYWQKMEKVGGTPDYTKVFTDSGYRDNHAALTGSGPLSWYFNRDISMETDFDGAVACGIRDIRVVRGEVQVVPNNLAADPDYTITNDSWRAIRPTGNGGHEFVTPDDPQSAVDPGTVHIVASGSSSAKYAARRLTAEELAMEAWKTVQWSDMSADADTMPSVPYILYEYGLLPIPGLTVPGGTTLYIGATTWFVYAYPTYTAILGLSATKSNRFSEKMISARLLAREKATA